MSLSSGVKLTYQQLNDQMLDEKVSQVNSIRAVLASSDNRHAIALGNDFYIVCDLNKKPHWCYSATPAIAAHNWKMAHDKGYLWLLKEEGMLSCFDIVEQKLQEFGHVMLYSKILYAEGDKVIVLRRNMPAIDVIELREKHLKRTASVLFETHGFMEDLDFLSERNRFFFLEYLPFENVAHYVLYGLDWHGQTEVLLDVRNANVKLQLPFVVILEKDSDTLMYMDLREEAVQLKQAKLHLNPEWAKITWRLNDVFAFNNKLFAKLSAPELDILIYLGQHPEVVIENQVGSLHLNQLGRFLVGSISRYDEDINKFIWQPIIYDLAAQQRTNNMSCSELLRQAFQDEWESHKSISRAKLQLPELVEEVSNLNTFKVLLRPSPSHTTQTLFDTFRILASVSSTRGDLALLAEGRVWLLRRDADQIQYVLPNTRNSSIHHLAGKWTSVTFDEQDKLWICDAETRYVAFVPHDGQEGLGFALNPKEPGISHIPGTSGVNSVCAYADHLAVISRQNPLRYSLDIYHFNKKSLKRVFSWESQWELVRIKPDTNRGGWWLMTFDSWTGASMLYYLEIKEGSPKVVETFYQRVAVLGNKPEQTYFIYLDKELVLHYTTDPNHGWRQIPLEHILGRSHSQDKPLHPISLQVIHDEIFLLLANYSSNDYLLMHLYANGAQLITALRCSSAVRIAHWKDWLIVYESYGNDSLAVSPAYSMHAQIDELPSNKRFFFYHPSTGGLYTAAHTPYSAMTTFLVNLLNKNGRNFSTL